MFFFLQLVLVLCRFTCLQKNVSNEIVEYIVFFIFEEFCPNRSPTLTKICRISLINNIKQQYYNCFFHCEYHINLKFRFNLNAVGFHGINTDDHRSRQQFSFLKVI